MKPMRWHKFAASIFLPDNAWAYPEKLPCKDKADRYEDSLADIVPTNRRQPFQMRKIIEAVVDRDGDASALKCRQIPGPASLPAWPVLMAKASAYR